MGELEIEAFLTYLAIRRKVSASTQNQAFNALLFLYRHVLKKELKGLGEEEREKLRFATKEMANEAINEGAVEFIAKPFKMNQIRGLIKQLADELINET